MGALAVLEKVGEIYSGVQTEKQLFLKTSSGASLCVGTTTDVVLSGNQPLRLCQVELRET